MELDTRPLSDADRNRGVDLVDELGARVRALRLQKQEAISETEAVLERLSAALATQRAELAELESGLLQPINALQNPDKRSSQWGIKSPA